MSLKYEPASEPQALCTVRYLAQGVGVATAAFAFEMLEVISLHS